MHKKLNFEDIEKFLEGKDPQKYITAIEGTYYENFVSLIINDPKKGKYFKEYTYTPFLWMKKEVADYLYGGIRTKIKKAMRLNNISIKELNYTNNDGLVPDRYNDAFNFIVKCKGGSFNNLVKFFKDGGVDIYSKDFKDLFVKFSPEEQFMIQTGKRLFKGMDDYNDIHRVQFDLETTGLNPSIDNIFQIGIKDNRGFEIVLETKGDTPKERRESERENIIMFFDIIHELEFDTLAGYNSDNFDFPFFIRRCDRLSLDITQIAKTLHPNKKIKWKEANLKLGGESEVINRTLLWGATVLDISHAVRRAQAINSDIKKWGLKYITKFSGVVKPNRVYVPGDKLSDTWSDVRDYWFNDSDGTWGLLVGELSEGLQKVKGDYIVQRYLIDDLWETEQIDYIYNQASYLIAKLLPTSYGRSSTMGTAGQWKLIMAAWSYENGLAIPNPESKRDFTGGLSRLLEVGFAKDVSKLDFAALYPKTQLTHDIFPSLDISGVMKLMLTYIVDKRDEFKFKTGKHKDRYKELEVKLLKERDNLDAHTIKKVEDAIKKHKKLASDFDKKQLPLKILANSFFGAYGAPHIFNWGDMDKAEETTCRGRQYLRLMVKHFTEKYNFRPLVGDTDGFNFAMPDNISDIKYTCKANHWKTEKYEEGQVLNGIEAVLSEFNEEYMIGRMGLDIDDICSSTINFKRKNYANAIDGKVKLVGNSIKSKSMPIYIEDFINKGIRLLLDGKGYDFIEYYYSYIDQIYNYNIPVAKIASKSKVKMTLDNYLNVYCKQKNKAGQFKSRQAHMELVNKNDLKVNLGDVIYYVNTGTGKSASDIKKITDKKDNSIRLEFNCEMIDTLQLENNPDLIVDDYNVVKYIDKFNKRISNLLVCFSEEIRKDIVINVVKDKKTKIYKLQERNYFTESQCELTAGHPLEASDQDTYEDLMIMEDKEIKFWKSVNMLPNNMLEEEWVELLTDYDIRMEKLRIDGIDYEKKSIIELFNRVEVNEFNILNTEYELPENISDMANLHVEDDGRIIFISNKWGVEIAELNTLLELENLAIERGKYYETTNASKRNYESWLRFKFPERYKDEVILGKNNQVLLDF